MGKIEGILIQNYGSLKSVKLGKLLSDQSGNVLGNMVTIIGPSGTGKSTVADAFGFIADCLRDGVEEACDANNRGGFEQLIAQNSSDPMHFEIYYRETSNTRPITYELTIRKDKNNRPYVSEERLRQRVKKSGRPLSFLYLQNGIGYAFEGAEGGQFDDGAINGEKKDVAITDNRKLAIATLGALKEYSRIQRFLEFLKSWYLCYFAPDSARHVQQAAPTPYLNKTGSNINNVAQYMFRENKAEFRRILDDIRSKLPGIENIEPDKMPNGQMVLRFWEKGFRDPFYSPRMSDGTLKLFAYYLLLHERTPRQLVFIEEPENGLYHQYLGDLAMQMRKEVGTGYSKQIFVTTHSPFFVNALSPQDVWVLNKESDGFSTIKRASEYPHVRELSEQDIPLGDLWYSRYFG